MAKVFSYAVKYKGKYYPPNTPIEEVKKPKAPKTGTKVEKKPRTKKVTKNEEVNAE